MERVYKREGILFKILPCLLIAMYAVMCLYGSTVCAYDVTYNDNTYTLNDEISNFKYIATVQVNNYVCILCSEKPFVFYVDGTDGGGNKIWRIGFPDTDDRFYYKLVWWTDVSKIPSYTLSDFTETKVSTSIFSIPQNWTEENHASSSFDLKDTDGNLVFQGASQEALATIIRPQVEGIQLQTILQEIIQILPLTIAVVVSFLGLRKALSWLLTRLRQS